MTILLGADNKVKYYVGLINHPIDGPKDVAYGKEGIRKELLSRKKKVLDYTRDAKKV